MIEGIIEPVAHSLAQRIREIASSRGLTIQGLSDLVSEALKTPKKTTRNNMAKYSHGWVLGDPPYLTPQSDPATVNKKLTKLAHILYFFDISEDEQVIQDIYTAARWITQFQRFSSTKFVYPPEHYEA